MRRKVFINAAVGLALAAVGSVLYQMVQNTPTLMRRKLTDCTNAVLEAGFAAPKGKLFNIVMGSEAGLATKDFTVELSLKSKDGEGAMMRVRQAELTPCNWLQDEGISNAYILNWSDKTFHIKPEMDYKLTFRFGGILPTNSSLWVTWIENYRDRKQSRLKNRKDEL